MESRRKLSIRYLEKIVKEDGINIPQYSSTSVTTSHIKRYRNCLYLLAGLKGCARNLMDYLTEVMDNNNHVVTNRHMLDSFINTMEQADIKYGIDVVNQSVRKLKDKNFIIQISKGYYLVNPNYFMKDDELKRAELIKIMLEFDYNKSYTEINTNINLEDARDTN